MTASYSQIERTIRAAWSGNPGATLGPDDLEPAILQELELLAAAPLASKPAHADAVRGAWVRSGGVVPVVPRPYGARPGTVGVGPGAI